MEHCYGTDRLDHLPALMSGYSSILEHPAGSAGVVAIDALRRLGAPLFSQGAIRRAIGEADDASRHGEDSHASFRAPPYRFIKSGGSYRFERRIEADPRPEQWVSVLTQGLVPASARDAFADLEKPFLAQSARTGDTRTIRFDLSHLRVAPPAPPRHNLDRRPAGALAVTLDELMAIAVELDTIDAETPGRTPRKWLERFIEKDRRKIVLLEPTANRDGLVEAKGLTFDGIKHLIGLPGSGKSSLITLIVTWAHRRGLRVVILVPSIIDAMKKIEELADYKVSSSLLSGQGGSTRSGHAQRFIQRLGSGEGQGLGLEKVPVGSQFLASGCALEAFDDDPKDDRRFLTEDPPCSRMEQEGLTAGGEAEVKKVLCPLSGWCGRMEAQRSLVDASVWIGHVLSLDTRVQPHFCAEDITYLELVSRTADLVIVDEADGAQHVLDTRAITRIDVAGTPDSIMVKLHKELTLPFSSGRNAMGSSNIANYQEAVSMFSLLTDRIVNHIQMCRKKEEAVLGEFEKGFLTGNRVGSSLYKVGANDPGSRERFGAITELVNSAIVTAMYGRDAPEAEAAEHMRFDPASVAVSLGVGKEAVERTWRDLRGYVQEWLRTTRTTSQEAILSEAQETLFALVPPDGHNDPSKTSLHAPLFRFWIEVTAVVTQFVVITQAQRAMVAEGVHRNVFFEKGMSEDFVRSVPEAMLGRLAGLSYEFRKGKGGASELMLSYMEFKGAPRSALLHLHELFRHEGRGPGPAVVVASATSFLKFSPSYHIDVGPDYVLRREGGSRDIQRSRFSFTPIDDPFRPGGKVFFSGARSHEDRVEALRSMARHFVGGLEWRIEDLNRKPYPGRLTGLVVNGYDQVVAFKEHAAQINAERARRIIGVVREIPKGSKGDWITPSQVETLGERTDWDAVIFPMKSLARGVNIVRSGGPMDGMAALGTIAFLTRPHPASESVDFIAGLVGATNMGFDRTVFPPDAGLPEIGEAFKEARAKSLRMARSILVERLLAIKLDAEMEMRFVADLGVDFIQTIGRGVRNGCSVRVLFVDAAWSRGTILSGKPSASDSTLVMLRDMLRNLVNETGGAEREIYSLLYHSFLAPLEACENLFPDSNEEDTDADAA